MLCHARRPDHGAGVDATYRRQGKARRVSEAPVEDHIEKAKKKASWVAGLDSNIAARRLVKQGRTHRGSPEQLQVTSFLVAMEGCGTPSIKEAVMDSRPTSGELGALLRRLVGLRVNGDAWRVLVLLMAEYQATGQTLFTRSVASLADELSSHRNSVARSLVALEAAGLVRCTHNHGGPRGQHNIALLVSAGAEIPPSNPEAPQVAAAAVEAQVAASALAESATAAKPPARRRRSRVNPAMALQDLLARRREIATRAGDCWSEIEAALLAAMGCPAQFQAQPAWGLSAADVEFLRLGIPDRAADEPAHRPSDAHRPPVARTKERISPQLELALRHAQPVIAQLAERHQVSAAKLLREIAYSVMHGQLRQGDDAARVRTALKLVEDGRWAAPRGMPTDWDYAAAEAET